MDVCTPAMPFLTRLAELHDLGPQAQRHYLFCLLQEEIKEVSEKFDNILNREAKLSPQSINVCVS